MASVSPSVFDAWHLYPCLSASFTFEIVRILVPEDCEPVVFCDFVTQAALAEGLLFISQNNVMESPSWTSIWEAPVKFLRPARFQTGQWDATAVIKLLVWPPSYPSQRKQFLSNHLQMQHKIKRWQLACQRRTMFQIMVGLPNLLNPHFADRKQRLGVCSAQ